MGIVSVVTQILTDSYRAEDETLLREEGNDHNGMPFVMEKEVVNKQGLSYALYRFDSDPKILFPYFEGGQSLRKMCDYILFAECNERNWCLLIELKRGKDKADAQLAAGEAFAHFIINAAERVGKEVALSNVEFRKVRVTENVSAKRETKLRTPEYENRFLNLCTEAFHLKQLLK